MHDSPFDSKPYNPPKIPLTGDAKKISLKELLPKWNGGELWIKNVTYHGSSEVHDPEWEAPPFFEIPQLGQLQPLDSGLHRNYVAYVEVDTIECWGRYFLKDLDEFPFEIFWTHMNSYRMTMTLHNKLPRRNKTRNLAEEEKDAEEMSWHEHFGCFQPKEFLFWGQHVDVEGS